jgi:hypothetical protein
MAPFYDADCQGRLREAMDATAVLDEVNVVGPRLRRVWGDCACGAAMCESWPADALS